MTALGALLQTSIYMISSSLFYPARVLLLVAFLWVVVLAGAFFAEWMERIRLPKYPSEAIPGLIVSGTESKSMPCRVRKYIQKLRDLLNSGKPTELQIENLMRDTTLRMWKSLDRLHILVRVGPSLGLVGTLIPMGTGLAGLGQGDMTRLSSDLVVAFTTTVVGLSTGVAAFFLYAVKRRWVEEDIKNLELATEVLVNGERKQ
ncbi:MAG: MotA/TolQ/ExbB proton channel family protein [Desulfococcaceae bacterium]